MHSHTLVKLCGYRLEVDLTLCQRVRTMWRVTWSVDAKVDRAGGRAPRKTAAVASRLAALRARLAEEDARQRALARQNDALRREVERADFGR